MSRPEGRPVFILNMLHLKNIIRNVWNKVSFPWKDKYKSTGSCESHYVSLTPEDNLDYEHNEYCKALNWALNQSDVRNIALAGPYGSGKSSIIDTFITHNLKISPLKVSMATFIENNGDMIDDDLEKQTSQRIDFSEGKIEEWILKQLFYKVSWKIIPQSRFHKIHNQSFWWLLVKLTGTLVIGLIFFFVFLPEDFAAALNLIILAGGKVGFSSWLSVILMAAIFGFILVTIAYNLKYYFPAFRVKKVSVPNVELEEKKIEDDSVFDQYLDEILYFFEVTEYDTVFFEDLDRLHQNKIFVHLRRLNSLLNNYDKIKQNIRFIYAVRDDIFTREDRTKFFDFIIPVIPVINSTNSGEIMLEWVRKNHLEQSLTEEYIDDVSPFIDDMRCLLNTFNEFLIYKKIIKDEQRLKLSDENMMSIIIFKNLYPKDFADIEKEEGIIKMAFRNKDTFITEESNEIKKRIQAKKEEISKYKNNILQSTKEIKFALFGELTDWNGVVSRISFNHFSGDFSFDAIMDSQFDLTKLNKEINAEIYYRTYRGSAENKTIFNLSILVAPYLERWNFVKEHTEEKMEDINKSIEEEWKKLREIFGYSLEDIIDSYGIEFFDPKVRANKFLVFLLRNGYINERYADYINYFKANSISADDKNFILAVKTRESLNPSYKLQNVAQIVKQLKNSDFEDFSICNYQLIDYLLDAYLDRACNGLQEKMKSFITALNYKDKKQWDWIDSFFDIADHKDVFLRLLSEEKPEFLGSILQSSLSDSRKVKYLIEILKNSSSETLKAMDSQKKISQFILKRSNILKCFNELEIHVSENIIKTLQLKFTAIEISDVRSEILDYIFDNRYYELNANMVNAIVLYKRPELVKDVGIKTYTVIRSLKYEALEGYIKDNIEQYMEDIEFVDTNVKESKSAVKDLIALNLLEPNICVSLIHRQSEIFFTDLMECYEDEWSESINNVQKIWNALLHDKKVKASWATIKQYWEKFKITDTLVEFITYCKNELQAPNDPLGNDMMHDFVCSEKISVAILEEVIPKLPALDYSEYISTIDPSKLLVLVKNKWIPFSIDNFEQLANIFSDEFPVNFLISNWEKVKEANITLSIATVTQLLGQTDLTKIDKEWALSHCEDSSVTQELVQEIVREKVRVPRPFFESIWNQADFSQKKFLMYNNLDSFECDDFQRLFGELGDEFNALTNRQRARVVKINNTSENQKLSNRLKAINYITSWEIGQDSQYLRLRIKRC